MCSKRDIVIFVAGAEAFHTVSHVIFGYAGILPMELFSIMWTQQLNMLAILINALITAGLLWWASKLK